MKTFLSGIRRREISDDGVATSRGRARLFLAVPIAALLVFAGQSFALASPPPGPPLGDPYEIVLNNAQQSAAIGGSATAFQSAICLSTGGTACLITAPIIASATAYMTTQALCANNGIRHIRLQDYQLPRDEFDPKAPRVAHLVDSSTCQPT